MLRAMDSGKTPSPNKSLYILAQLSAAVRDSRLPDGRRRPV